MYIWGRGQASFWFHSFRGQRLSEYSVSFSRELGESPGRNLFFLMTSPFWDGDRNEAPAKEVLSAPLVLVFSLRSGLLCWWKPKATFSEGLAFRIIFTFCFSFLYSYCFFLFSLFLIIVFFFSISVLLFFFTFQSASSSVEGIQKTTLKRKKKNNKAGTTTTKKNGHADKIKRRECVKVDATLGVRFRLGVLAKRGRNLTTSNLQCNGSSFLFFF